MLIPIKFRVCRFLRCEFQNVVQSLCKSVVQKIMHKIT